MKYVKYIRTKDGIYETIDYDQLPNNLKKQLDEREHSCMKDYKEMGVFAKMKQGALIISNIQPILLFAIQNQADTIEELCDVFVGVDKNGKHYTNSESVNDLIHMTYDILHVTLTTIYGEIWVNDELHKVAKMNDKGDLEML